MIRIKFLGKVSVREWARYFSDDRMIIGNCQFTFDRHDRNYDWLVVYDDFPYAMEGKRGIESERLNCPRQQTILVTTEPSSIKSYGRAYSSQFGYVLTSQEPWALPHPHRIYSQTGLRWFYGVGSRHVRSLNEMLDAAPPVKTRLISAASSDKRQRHTLHHKRYHFVQSLKLAIPETDIYGHGIRPMDDKAEAIDPYYFHVAIENHIAPHHWTEKLSDTFLGFALPFYAGAPNAGEYFPPESFIPIDLDRPAEAIDTIKNIIHSNEYARRLPYLREARHLVLTKYNLMQMLCEHIASAGVSSGETGCNLLSRHALRKSHPLVMLQDVVEKTKLRVFGGIYKRLGK
jgi:hypothetical protein